MEKPMPHNIRAEQGVLSCIIINGPSLEQVIDTLSPDDFYRDAHRTVYSAMVSLYHQHISCDALRLCDELERQEKLEDIGGMSYVFSLPDLELNSSRIEDYAAIVLRDAQCRRIIAAATSMVTMAYERDEKTLDRAEEMLFQIGRTSARSTFTSMQDVVSSYMQELEFLHVHQGQLVGVPTGFRDLDKLLCGMQKTDLLVLAGRPGMGKTALAMSMVRNAAKKGHGIAVFSLEMGQRQLARRLMSMESGVDMQSLRTGWLENHQWEPIINSVGSLSSYNIWINDASTNPVASMRAELRRLMHRTTISLVVVDYLQLIDTAQEGKKGRSRADEISEIARGLKRIAKEFDVPVLALAQLSRQVESRQNKRPMLSDLKESGGIEENADVVAFIYRDDYYATMEGREDYTPSHIAEIIVAKHRNGEQGEVCLYFKGEQTGFYDLDRMHGKGAMER